MEGRHRRVRVKLVPLLVAMGGGALAAWALKGGSAGNRAPETPAGGEPALVTARLLASPAASSAAEDLVHGLPAPSAPRDAGAPPAAAPTVALAPATFPADGAPAGDAPPEPGGIGAGGDPAGDGPPAEPEPSPPPPTGSVQAEVVSPAGKLRFREIWAYLMPGAESRWAPEAPITDLGLFDFSLDPTGRLKGKANQKAIERAAARGIRTHLVIASSGNKSLLHLALSPRYGVRQALLADIAELPRRHRVSGVQLDLEGPRTEEREDLLSFIG